MTDVANESSALDELVIPLCSEATATRAPELVLLLDRLRTALASIANAGPLEHRRGAVAMRHLEFEIAPVLESLNLDDIVARIVKSGVDREALRRAMATELVGRSYLSHRWTAPVQSGWLYPGHSTRIPIPMITAEVRIDRFHISNMISRWFVIEDINVNGVPLIPAGNVDGRNNATMIAQRTHGGFGRAQSGSQIYVTVRYTGVSDEDGTTSTEPLQFDGFLSGEYAMPSLSFQANVGVSRSMGSTVLRSMPASATWKPTRLMIPGALASQFIIESLTIGGVEQFPNELFGMVFSSELAEEQRMAPGSYNHCVAGSIAELRVRYTGPIEGGALFNARLYGELT